MDHSSLKIHVEWMRDIYLLSNSTFLLSNIIFLPTLSFITGQFEGDKKYQQASALPTELPGFLVTFIMAQLVTTFNALLVVGTEMEWEPKKLSG